MTKTDTEVTSLIVNKLTLSQYAAAKSGNELVATEVYTITDLDTAVMPSSVKYAANLDFSINSSTYVITAQLKDQDGNNLGNSRTIDLPLESVVVNGSYDSTNKKIILTLQSGSTIDIPVGDLIAGLQTEITSSNKLDADLVDDSTSTNKFVTASDKTTWNGKQDAISDLSTIRSGAEAGATALQPNTAITAATKCKITYDANGLVTAGADLQASDIPDISFTYQTKITSSNKISADNISDGTTNKVVTATEKFTWSGKQDALVSGTNIKTINNTSILGSGNISVDSLPSQTGNTGKFLTTNGTSASWATVDALPSQTSQSGKFLTTNGTTASWANVDALPSQSGQNGKYLTTNGTSASWSTVSATSDGTTISANSGGALQAIGLVNKNTATGATNPKYDWVGTLSQWTSQNISTSHPDWVCYITDDSTAMNSVDWSILVNVPSNITALGNGTLDCGTM